MSKNELTMWIIVAAMAICTLANLGCDGTPPEVTSSTVILDEDGKQIMPSDDDEVIWRASDHEVVKTEDIGNGWIRETYDDGTVSETSPSHGPNSPPPPPGR